MKRLFFVAALVLLPAFSQAQVYYDSFSVSVRDSFKESLRIMTKNFLYLLNHQTTEGILKSFERYTKVKPESESLSKDETDNYLNWLVKKQMGEEK